MVQNIIDEVVSSIQRKIEKTENVNDDKENRNKKMELTLNNVASIIVPTQENKEIEFRNYVPGMLENFHRFHSLNQQLEWIELYIPTYIECHPNDLQVVCKFINQHYKTLKNARIQIGSFRRLAFKESDGFLGLTDFSAKDMEHLCWAFNHTFNNLRELIMLYCGNGVNVLSNYSFGNLEILETSANLAELPDDVKFDKVKKLILHHAQINQTTIEKLSKTFPNLQKLEFIKPDQTCSGWNDLIEKTFTSIGEYDILQNATTYIHEYVENRF